MGKIVFLGSDLHLSKKENPTELASKTVKNLSKKFKDYKVVSLQDIKPSNNEEENIILKGFFNSRKLRLFFLGIQLPFHLLFLRIRGYSKIAFFWTADSYYHHLLFLFLKLIRYKLFFTVISDYTRNYSSLRFCDVIIAQSDKMNRFLKKKLPDNEITTVYPGVDLDTFKPGKKKDLLVIPSSPHDVSEFYTRSFEEILNLLKKNKIDSVIITRSLEVSNYLKKQKIPQTKIINEKLSDTQLAFFLRQAKLIPLFYYKRGPDMPLSGIEAMACGCTILCSGDTGFSEIVRKNKSGLVRDKISIEDIKAIFKNASYAKNARKTAEKYFNIKNMLKRYEEILKK